MRPKMNILLLEPYYTDSHRSWAEGYAAHSRHKVRILSLPGVHWKWRMHGAAASFAERLRHESPPDVMLASEMLDLATFKGLMPDTWSGVPSVLYFHENQLSYPWSENDTDSSTGRDLHYAWIHVTGCLAATEVWFNSAFHRDSFFARLEPWLSTLPSPSPVPFVGHIREKSHLMPLGLNPDLAGPLPTRALDTPVILWNHRWEYDKDPDAFFSALRTLSQVGIPFELVVLGRKYRRSPKVFAQAKTQLERHILHWGYADSRQVYLDWLQRSTILPVTSQHDFFGLSVLEAIASGAFPLLPDRLVYPEHVSDFPSCLYDPAATSLADQLRALLSDELPDISGLREQVLSLTWDHVAPHYDEAISRMMAKKHHL